MFEGGDILFGIAEVDPAGAGFTGDDEGTGSFAPALGGGTLAAETLLFFEGHFFGGGLGGGGDGGVDGVSHG